MRRRRRSIATPVRQTPGQSAAPVEPAGTTGPNTVGNADMLKLLLVDFENVQEVELSKLDDNFSVIIFVGAEQRSIPLELVTKAQKLGNRVEWQKISGSGSNALDFFIAFHLGRVIETSPDTQCTVLSKDKGFDPLLRYLNANGLKTRRINSLHELHAKATPAPVPGEPNYRRVLEVLGKSERRSRPRKRKTLSQCISAMFQKKISQADIDHIIGTMLANRMISETNNAITYEF